MNMPKAMRHWISALTKRGLLSRGLGLLAIGLAVLLPVTGSLAQTVSFSTATDFAVGSGPYSIAIGDLNGDGKPDLAVANRDGNSVSILIGTGSGAFGSATNLAVGSLPFSVAIGDLNGDGISDLAVANLYGDSVSILLGTGAGVFGAAENFAVGFGPHSVAIGDLNGDGIPDLAAANGGSNTVTILLGIGAGAFGAATNFAVGSNPWSVAIEDLNGDGKPDLAVANFNSNTVSILLGTGTGAFGAATNYAVGVFGLPGGPGSGSISVAIGDLNGDGKPDLAVANILSNEVSILLGSGAGAFGGPTNFAAGPAPNSVAIGDLNADGIPDLAVANGVSAVSILLGTGAGAFGTATNFAVGLTPVSVAIGDLNGDGKLDLAVANVSSNTVSILLNTPAPNDTVPPTSTASATPMRNAAGWNNSNVTVTLNATDNPEGSGVKSISYVIANGSNVSGATVAGATASFTISAEGVNTITYHATDNAGNVEVDKILIVRIDRTAPTASLTLSPTMLWPPNHKFVPITATLNATDPGGGLVAVAGPFVSSSEPVVGGSDNTAPDWIVNPGTVQLRAERTGEGNGRVYTINYVVTDQAGNSTNVSGAVTVPHHRGR